MSNAHYCPGCSELEGRVRSLETAARLRRASICKASTGQYRCALVKGHSGPHVDSSGMHFASPRELCKAIDRAGGSGA